MPKPDSPKPVISEIEKLFEDLIPHIPPAIRQACQSLGHHPGKMEFDGLVSRIMMLLMDNDFHTLHSFDNRSEPQTWLFIIAKRYVLRMLQKQKREVSLNDLPLDCLTLLPDQEETLILEEREKLLLAAVGKLTQRERELFYLIAQGLKTEEIAKTMKIRRKSVYPEKSALIKKLQNIVSAA